MYAFLLSLFFAALPRSAHADAANVPTIRGRRTRLQSYVVPTYKKSGAKAETPTNCSGLLTYAKHPPEERLLASCEENRTRRHRLCHPIAAAPSSTRPSQVTTVSYRRRRDCRRSTSGRVTAAAGHLVSSSCCNYARLQPRLDDRLRDGSKRRYRRHRQSCGVATVFGHRSSSPRRNGPAYFTSMSECRDYILHFLR